MTSLYDELGVEPTASKDDIKKAFRKKAKTEHPDVGGDPEKFQRIVKAYMILYDDISRARYNRTGEEEKPKDLKKDLNKVAETFLIQMTFSIIDELGENINIKNLKDKMLETLADVRKDLFKRKKMLKETYKAILKKKQACADKIKKLNSYENSKNRLIEILQRKIEQISIQEELPAKEELYKLITDIRTTLRVKLMVNNDCFDFTVERKADPMEEWDKQMNFDRWGGTSTSTTANWF